MSPVQILGGGGSGAGGSMVYTPTYLAPGVRIALPANTQMLFSEPIMFDTGAGIDVGLNSVVKEVS